MGNVLAFLGRDVAVDLGTANTTVYVRRGGSRWMNRRWWRSIRITARSLRSAVKRSRWIGRTPENIVAIRPLKDGVIADFDVTERMLRYFIHKVHRRRPLAKPRLVVAVPSGITGVEQSAVKEAVMAAALVTSYAATGSVPRPRRPARTCAGVAVSRCAPARG
jgi:rod shape-determining protein MreB and related proteins